MPKTSGIAPSGCCRHNRARLGRFRAGQKFSEHGLSERELQIARSYAAGATYNAIADELVIAPSTVRTHLATIYCKLEVSSKLELLARLDCGTSIPRDNTDLNAIISELAFNLEEAISRKKALSEVLKIISGSHGGLDVVMPSILGHGLELCEAEFGILFNIAKTGASVPPIHWAFPQPFSPSWTIRGNSPLVPRPGWAVWMSSAR